MYTTTKTTNDKNKLSTCFFLLSSSEGVCTNFLFLPRFLGKGGDPANSNCSSMSSFVSCTLGGGRNFEKNSTLSSLKVKIFSFRKQKNKLTENHSWFALMWDSKLDYC